MLTERKLHRIIRVLLHRASDLDSERYKTVFGGQNVLFFFYTLYTLVYSLVFYSFILIILFCIILRFQHKTNIFFRCRTYTYIFPIICADKTEWLLLQHHTLITTLSNTLICFQVTVYIWSDAYQRFIPTTAVISLMDATSPLIAAM